MSSPFAVAEKPAKPFDIADRRMAELLQANVTTIAAMYAALSEIARSEVSLDGQLASRRIANETLIEVHRIAEQISASKIRFDFPDDHPVRRSDHAPIRS